MEEESNNKKEFDVLILGGLGHVGLPLGIVCASKGMKVCLLDLDKEKADLVMEGVMPFIEYGAESLLKEALSNNLLEVSLDKKDVQKAKIIIIAIGTPVDQHLNPKTKEFLETLDSFKEYLDHDQTIIVRSTVYPHTCEQILRLLGGDSSLWSIAYCPERIAQGYSVQELGELPQIIAGLSEKAIRKATELFEKISPRIIYSPLKEAELSKLFSNTWRYIQFAATNQFYMTATRYGADYNKILHIMRNNYKRAEDIPNPGFAAGPCLLKDTMQLVALDDANFPLGNSAMTINEGLPNFIVDNLRKKYDLSKIKVGILGMAFKAEVDDIRESLSYKLVKILKFHGAKVYCSDEFIKDPSFVSKEELAWSSNIIIVGAPHSKYSTLKIPENTEVIDLWGITEKKNGI